MGRMTHGRRRMADEVRPRRDCCSLHWAPIQKLVQDMLNAMYLAKKMIRVETYIMTQPTSYVPAVDT